MADLQEVHYETFKSGSKTYYNSSRFFPADVRRDVYLLYGFVRVADNFVDRVPQDSAGFESFTDAYRRALSGETTNDPIIDGYVDLARRKRFEPDWTEAFLHSMRLDLVKSRHETLPESLEYIYGSAEVIGLFMARIMDLPEQAYESAMMLGRAMQYINFIRDIAEDNKLGRLYLPVSESSLSSLDEAEVRKHPEEFRDFIAKQLDRYMVWQSEAERGYRYIPKRYRVPIKTAGDMYKWTGHEIAENPFVVFDRKIKPRKARIVLAGLMNMLTA